MGDQKWTGLIKNIVCMQSFSCTGKKTHNLWVPVSVWLQVKW